MFDGAADEIRGRYGLATWQAACGPVVYAKTARRSRNSGLSAPPAAGTSSAQEMTRRPAPPSPRYLHFLQMGFDTDDLNQPWSWSRKSASREPSQLSGGWSSQSRQLAESLSRPGSGREALSVQDIRQLTHRRPGSPSSRAKSSQTNPAHTESLFTDSTMTWNLDTVNWSVSSGASHKAMRRRQTFVGPVQAARRHVKRMRKLKRRERRERDMNDSDSDDETGQAVRTAGAVLGEPAQAVHHVKKSNPFVEYDTKEKRWNMERKWLQDDQEYLESRVREARHSNTQAKLSMRAVAQTLDRPLTRQEALMSEVKTRKGISPRPPTNWLRSVRGMQRELKESSFMEGFREVTKEEPMKPQESLGAKLFAGKLSFLMNSLKAEK